MSSISQSLRRSAKPAPARSPAASENEATRLGRQLYAEVTSRMKLAIGSALRENRGRIVLATKKDTRKIRAFLSRVLGDALTDVIDTSEDDLDAMADNIAVEEVPPEVETAQDELPIEDEPPSALEDEVPPALEDEPMAAADDDETPPEEEEEEKASIADSLSNIKAQTLAQAKRLAKIDPDAAASLHLLAQGL